MLSTRKNLKKPNILAIIAGIFEQGQSIFAKFPSSSVTVLPYCDILLLKVKILSLKQNYVLTNEIKIVRVGDGKDFRSNSDIWRTLQIFLAGLSHHH